jgi:uncharacterized protein YdhG (YjbR/CyaY superfamily)
VKLKKASRQHTAAPAKADKPETHDGYLAAVSDDKRAALETLRKNIKAAAPQAEECISYQIPAFRLNGKLLVAYGAAAKHCAFYPGSVVAVLKDELKEYATSKGTIRFSADRPLPPALMRKLVKLRIAKNSADSECPQRLTVRCSNSENHSPATVATATKTGKLSRRAGRFEN